MITWGDLQLAQPELASKGGSLLFRIRHNLGYAFLATLRKDGAPRLHPVSVVHCAGHLYIFIPPASPKCADLLRDGRFALQAFPRPDSPANEELYLSGRAECVQDERQRQVLIEQAQIRVEPPEVLFELFLERAMYSFLAGDDASPPIHIKWRSA